MEVKQTLVVLRIFLIGRAKNEEDGLEASVRKGPIHLSVLFIQVAPKPA